MKLTHKELQVRDLERIDRELGEYAESELSIRTNLNIRHTIAGIRNVARMCASVLKDEPVDSVDLDNIIANVQVRAKQYLP